MLVKKKKERSDIITRKREKQALELILDTVVDISANYCLNKQIGWASEDKKLKTVTEQEGRRKEKKNHVTCIERSGRYLFNWFRSEKGERSQSDNKKSSERDNESRREENDEHEVKK